MVKCGFCQKVIESPREYRDEVVQKFCSDGCRYHFHNSLKREQRVFFKETMSLLRKFSGSRGELSREISD
jgi:hypothetical protein